jgi:hypothetical protein
MDSKRLRALKALTTHLETEVSIVNGYQHDLAGAVFRGRLLFGPQQTLPSVAILDNPDPDRFPRMTGGKEYESDTRLNQWVLLVQGWADDDKIHPTDPAHNLLADVVKALAKISQGMHPTTFAPGHPNYMLGDLISGMTMEPGVVRPPQEGVSDKAFFWMRIMLQFVEDTNDPYA